MSWRAITTADVEDSMHKHEIEAVQERYLADGQDDPVPATIAEVTLEIREAIRSCADNRLHPDSTFVPAGAIGHAKAIARQRLLARLDLDLSETRRDEYREALRYLDKVASCQRSVERYGADEDAPAPVTVPQVNARTKRFTRAQQDGI